MNEGDRAVRTAYQNALNADTEQALTDFLTEGRYTAREEDERVQLLTVVQLGGPQVKAASTRAR